MFKSIARLRIEEKIIFVVGILLSIGVFYFINRYVMDQGMLIWALVEAGIMWVVIISLLLLADNQRVLNEELKEILREQIQESKTLRQISNEELQEIKLMKEVANEAMQLMKKNKKSK